MKETIILRNQIERQGSNTPFAYNKGNLQKTWKIFRLRNEPKQFNHKNKKISILPDIRDKKMIFSNSHNALLNPLIILVHFVSKYHVLHVAICVCLCYCKESRRLECS